MSSISFGGVGSGLPVSDWIDALMATERKPIDTIYANKSNLQTSKTTLSTVEGKMSSLRSAMEKFTDANLSSSFDLFQKMMSSTSNDKTATATATNKAATQKINLKIANLATATKAQSITGAGRLATGTDKIVDLGNAQGSIGKFSVYVNGVKSVIELKHDDDPTKNVESLEDIAREVRKIGGIEDAGIQDGKFYIKADSSVSDIKFGSSSDTSNFLNIAKLSTVDTTNPQDKTFSSATELTAIKTGAGLLDNTANLNTAVTKGTFTIGKSTFTIDGGTTLDNLIAKINKDANAGVTAQYDMSSNKMILTSKNPGKVAIDLKDGDDDPATDNSNFLTAMGLIESGTGNATKSQTLGLNAKVTLNDSSTIESPSNTLTGDITGIGGVTINLKNITDATSTDNKSVNIDISQDTSQLTGAVDNFITKFNDLFTEIDKDTASDGNLKGETSLSRLRSDFRYSISNSVSGLSTYNSLASIGISTGSVGKSKSDTSAALVLDKDKLMDALSKNPNEVKALLIGDKSRGIRGIFQTMKSKADSALDVTNGYFTARKNSMNTMITGMEKSIADGELRLQNKKDTLTRQFNQMDQMISQMKAQSSSLFGA